MSDIQEILIYILIPLLFSIIIFGIVFIVRKLIKREAKSNKKVFLLTTIISYLLFGLFIYLSIPRQVYGPRAQVSEAMSLAAGYKTVLTEFYEEYGKWPSSLDEINAETSGKFVDNIVISQGAGASGDIIILATFKKTGVHKNIQGKTFSISSDDGGKNWQCGLNAISGTNLESNNLPGVCK